MADDQLPQHPRSSTKLSKIDDIQMYQVTNEVTVAEVHHHVPITQEGEEIPEQAAPADADKEYSGI